MKTVSKATASTMLLLIAMAHLLLSACNKTDPESGGLKRGYATGRVLDTNGQPMAGVEVVANNSMIGNSNPVGVTDASGRYKIQLPPVGTFHTSASFRKTFNGKTYTLDLKPDTHDEYSIEGAVRNFQWTLTGEKATTMQGHYGATIGFNTDFGSLITDYDKIEWTLVPQGKLIDGSTGTTLVIHCGPAYSIDFGELRDIPIGRYKVSAVYKDGGAEQAVKVRYNLSESSTYAYEMIMDFEPQTIAGNNVAQLLCRE